MPYYLFSEISVFHFSNYFTFSFYRKQISNFDVEMEALDDETNDFVNDEESFEDNAESESSFDTRFEPFLNIPHYDDVPSDDSEEVEDYLQITDTDSSVFIWDCNNDFYPHVHRLFKHKSIFIF